MKNLWRIIKLYFKGAPLKTWRKLPNGKYICDGDCGRWSLHGVCTCGLCHYFSWQENHRDLIERDTVSWVREGDTRHHMEQIPYREHCSHGRHLNDQDECRLCEQEVIDLFKRLGFK
jgi:hypothetical protein